MARFFSQPKLLFKQNTFFQTENGLLSFCLIRSNARRNLSISVNEQADVAVSVPYHCPEADVFAFVSEKLKWIFSKVDEARRRQRMVHERRYGDGESFPFLGKDYNLRVGTCEGGRTLVERTTDELLVRLPCGVNPLSAQSRVRASLLRWYQVQADSWLRERTQMFSQQTGLDPERIAVRSFKRIWGNCDFHKRLIQYNWQIILFPESVIDYVIVHELCHLSQPNHSRKFWSLLERYLPAYREQRSWLRKNSLTVSLP